MRRSDGPPRPDPAALPIGDIVVTPRSLSDYRDMFLLEEGDVLGGPILDCPGGASPFGAQVRARGGTVVSVDPEYHRPRHALVERVRADLERTAAWMDANPGNFDWSYLGSPRAVTRAFELAAELFATDYAPDGRRYVAAGLPHLPFGDRRFRLTLSSHLLFSYPAHLDFDAHVAGLEELVRVTAGEVRVYPLVDTAGRPYPRLEEVRAALADQGVDSEVRAARCAWQPGGDQLLACWRRAGLDGAAVTRR
jgi:hypothetical protein